MFGYRLFAPNKGDYPFTPFAHIELQSYSADASGVRLLSGQLMTDLEIDARIQVLKDNLDQVARAAKRARRKAQTEVLDRPSRGP